MASKNTNTRVPTPSNPSSLPPRYEIRKLTLEHSEWAASIVIHSNLFHSPLWPNIYPERITDKVHRTRKAIGYLVNHQIESGLSYGAFDTEYQFKNPASAATGGKLYWDESEPSILETEGLEAESARLLAQMDFPLVSVALSYDQAIPLDGEKVAPMTACLPHFGLLYHILAEKDPRSPESWQATAPGQVLMRNATSTRRDYEGQKIMGGLARWLMREACAKGFRGIQIETVNDAVYSVWMRAEEPFNGSEVSSFDTRTHENEEGVKEFAPAELVIGKVWVDLTPGQ